MNIAVQRGSKMKIISPCEECIVRSTCTQFCLNWVNHCRRFFVLDEDIPFEEFKRFINLCGPFENYFRDQYQHISHINFPTTPPTKILISIDRTITNNVKEDKCCLKIR